MKHEYVKVVEGGKEIIRMMSKLHEGPGREVDVSDWDIDSYIIQCLYPIQGCIARMRAQSDDGSELYHYSEILERLYDAAYLQLGKMSDAIYKDMGWIRIKTTSESCRGGFLQQDFLEVYVKPEPVEAKVG